MAKNKTGKRRRCIAYLSTVGQCKNIAGKEAGQLTCIKEYAQAHELEIVSVWHRDGMGAFEVRKHFLAMADLIRKRTVEAVVVVKMAVVSDTMEDAYSKIGMIAGAGGRVISVNEGELSLDLHMNVRKDV